MLGVTTRTHDLLGKVQPSQDVEWARTASALAAEVKTWEELGLDRATVAKALFEQRYPSYGTVSASLQKPGTDPQQTSVLFEFPAGRCQELLNADDVNLVRSLRSAAIYGTWSKLPDIIADPATLRRLLQEVLCPVQ